MTDQAQPASNHDLVGLYAGRVRARYRRPERSGTQHRQMRGVRTFGRRPSIRQLPVSRRRRAVAALVATAMVATAAPALASGSGSSHEVQLGETLTGISQEHGISLVELMRINDIDDPDVIYAGDLLNIGERFGIDVGDTVYRVKEGDTLFEIAQAHNVSLEDLLTVNEIENENLIYPGHILVIPAGGGISAQEHVPEPVGPEPADEVETHPEAQPAGQGQIDDAQIASLHLVARGETLGAIAMRYGVSVERLAAANDIANHHELQVGTLLRIPVPQSTADEPLSDVTFEESSSGTILEGLPVIEQSLPLATEAAALNMVTAYWGFPVSDWVFIENMPYHPNPHHGFRGEMNQQYGGTDNYGVYPGPLSAMLANYGFIGDEFYTRGDPTELRLRIDDGQPVLVWKAAPSSNAEPFQETYDGETFKLLEGQHVAVVYGYDDTGVHIADPAAAEQRVLGWDEFLDAWSKMDGMAMAVYPKH